MSLATRCTACGTVFRVVQDQLKISEGWVRCGRCSEVFNAFDGLLDLQRDAPSEPQPDAAAEASLDEEIDAHLFGPPHADDHRAPARHVDQRDRIDFSDARFDSELPAEALLATPSVDAASLVPDPVELPLEVAAAPGFMRRAARRARWRSPLARGALGAGALLLLTALTLQAGSHFRDPLAARWPQLKPALLQWCVVAHCTLAAPRRIEDISVESSALTRAPGLDAFRLAVMLRNHGTLPLALPSVELSLTDAAGKLVARRALAPRDFRVATALLPPGAELPLQLLLDARNTRVTGYTVEIFYP